MKKIFLLSSFFFLFPILAQAQELRVSTIERKPFVFIEEQHYSGFSVDLWEAIATDNQWDFKYVESASFVELLRSARESSTDLSIANIAATTDRAELMDFSDPIFDTGLQIMTPRIERFVYFYESLSLAQSMLLLATLCIFALILSGALWLAERTKQKTRTASKKNLTETVCMLMTLGSFGRNLPATSVGKFIILVWIITAVFSIAVYIAGFARTVSSLIEANTINSYQDLRGKKIGTTRGSTSQAFLRKHKIEAVEYINPEQLFAATALGEIDAALHDVALLQYFAANQGQGNVTILPQVYDQKHYAIALPLDSDLRELINNSLAKFRLDGTYHELYNKWFTQK